MIKFYYSILSKTIVKKKIMKVTTYVDSTFDNNKISRKTLKNKDPK